MLVMGLLFEWVYDVDIVHCSLAKATPLDP